MKTQRLEQEIVRDRRRERWLLAKGGFAFAVVTALVIIREIVLP